MAEEAQGIHSARRFRKSVHDDSYNSLLASPMTRLIRRNERLVDLHHGLFEKLLKRPEAPGGAIQGGVLHMLERRKLMYAVLVAAGGVIGGVNANEIAPRGAEGADHGKKKTA